MGKQRGFTVLELLVVVSVTALLSSILIIYGRGSRDQTNLYVEAVRLAQAISRAKSLAMATFSTSSIPSICGYGVHPDYVSQQYSLSAYKSSDCSVITDLVSLARDDMTRFTINPEIRMRGSSSSLTGVLFVPPDPLVFVSVGGSLITSGDGALELVNKSNTIGIKVSVNTFGQINISRIYSLGSSP